MTAAQRVLSEAPEDQVIGILRRTQATINDLAPLLSEAYADRAMLVHALTDRGWTQRRIAKELGVSQPTVHRIVNGTEGR